MDDKIAQFYADMTQLTQWLTKLPTEYAQTLWDKELRCDRVYDENLLDGILFKDCPGRLPTECICTGE